MKKSLLSVIAVTATLVASAATLVQNEHPALVAHPLNGPVTEATASRNVFKAPANKALSVNNLAGTYVQMYYDYYDGSTAFGEVTITAGEEENTIVISGWWGSWAKDLTATVDPTAGTVTIPRQPVYEYTGDISADFVNVNDTTAAVVGTIYSDAIAFNNPWGAKLENMNNYYVIGLNTYLIEPNATMTYGTTTNQLYTEQDGKQVFVGNFGDYGVGINVDLHADKTFSIEPQLVGTSSNGDFYTTDIYSWFYGDPQYTPAPITGTGTDNTLTSAGQLGWTAGASTGYWYGQLSNFTITFNEPLEWPVAATSLTLNATDDDELALSLNEGTELPSTFQLEVTEVLPEGADTEVVWTSSDESVAKVDENGLVTAQVFDGRGQRAGKAAPYDKHYAFSPVTITATAVESDANAAPASASVTMYVQSSTRTAVESINAATVESVKYVNAQGVVSSTPFDGLNIEVRQLSDGSTKVVKVLK